MSEFNFKSSVCTSRVQSESLLALGLKPETADMIYERNVQYPYDYDLPRSIYDGEEFITGVECDDIPAWSLHRLLSLYNLHYIEFMNDEEIENVYDIAIDAIEQAIKEGYFNKEYLI